MTVPGRLFPTPRGNLDGIPLSLNQLDATLFEKPSLILAEKKRDTPKPAPKQVMLVDPEAGEFAMVIVDRVAASKENPLDNAALV